MGVERRVIPVLAEAPQWRELFHAIAEIVEEVAPKDLLVQGGIPWGMRIDKEHYRQLFLKIVTGTDIIFPSYITNNYTIYEVDWDLEPGVCVRCDEPYLLNYAQGEATLARVKEIVVNPNTQGKIYLAMRPEEVSLVEHLNPGEHLGRIWVEGGEIDINYKLFYQRVKEIEEFNVNVTRPEDYRQRKSILGLVQQLMNMGVVGTFAYQTKDENGVTTYPDDASTFANAIQLQELDPITQHGAAGLYYVPANIPFKPRSISPQYYTSHYYQSDPIFMYNMEMSDRYDAIKTGDRTLPILGYDKKILRIDGELVGYTFLALANNS